MKNPRPKTMNLSLPLWRQLLLATALLSPMMASALEAEKVPENKRTALGLYLTAREAAELKAAQGPAVLFVKADWCPHCRAAKPQVEEASRMLAAASIGVYAVDSEKHKAYIQKLRVPGFPTILFVDAAGKTHTFPGGDRSSERIASWVCVSSGACAAGGGGRR